MPGEILSPRIRNLISNLGLILGSAAVVYFWITGSSSRTTDSPDQYLPGHANAANEMLQKLFDRVPAMITVYHPDMDRFLVNREFEEVTGWSNREANSPL
ncbi:MAG: hypothetical protein R3281_15330 [Balneolaceae bacterium]|nr:hypothetical protein [Balneolaceae bacterium]